MNYAPWMEPYYPKGIGDYTVDAYKNYCAAVDRLVAQATPEDLESWAHAFKVFQRNSGSHP